MKDETRGKKENVVIVIKGIVLIFISIFLVFLFYNLCYASDIMPHAERAEGMERLLLKGPIYFFSHSSHTYPAWHISYLLIKRFIQPFTETLQTLSLDYRFLSAAFTCTLAIIGLYLACEYTFKNMLPHKQQGKAFVFAWLLIFTGPYYVKAVNESYYLGQGIIVPWHNPTTIAVYPIAILCFALYFSIAQEKQDEIPLKKWVMFSILLFLSCIAKPSFYQMFIPGIAIYCFFELLFSKGKRIVFGIYSFVAVFPTCLLALFQLKAEVHVSEEGMLASIETGENAALMVAKVIEESSYGIRIGGIGIEWLKVQKIFSPEKPILSLILLWVFPIFVILLYFINQKRNIKMSLPLCIASSGTLQYTLLYLQMRPETGDFAWGYYMSMAVLFIGCISYFLEICEEKRYKFVKWVGFGLFFGHVFWGLYYAIRLTDYGFKYSYPLF